MRFICKRNLDKIYGRYKTKVNSPQTKNSHNFQAEKVRVLQELLFREQNCITSSQITKRIYTTIVLFIFIRSDDNTKLQEARRKVTDARKLHKTLKVSETGPALLDETQHCLGAKEVKKR